VSEVSAVKTVDRSERRRRRRPAVPTDVRRGRQRHGDDTSRANSSVALPVAVSSPSPDLAIGRQKKRVNSLKDSVGWLSVPSYAVRLSRKATWRTDGGRDRCGPFSAADGLSTIGGW